MALAYERAVTEVGVKSNYSIEMGLGCACYLNIKYLYFTILAACSGVVGVKSATLSEIHLGP